MADWSVLNDDEKKVLDDWVRPSLRPSSQLERVAVDDAS